MHLEALAQQQLLEAVIHRAAPAPDLIPLHPDSLQAYRGSLAANALHAMGIMYPTVLRVLEQTDFDPLVQLYLAKHPPTRGDWAQYGEHFASWLRNANPGQVCTALPFLPDIAAIDCAIARCENAPDQTLQTDSLNLLSQAADSITLVLQDHVQLVDCAFDVSALFAQTPSNEVEQGPTYICFTRVGWRAQVHTLTAAQACCAAQCLAGANLHQAVTQSLSLDPSFDFDPWLIDWVQHGRVLAVRQIVTSSNI